MTPSRLSYVYVIMLVSHMEEFPIHAAAPPPCREVRIVKYVS